MVSYLMLGSYLTKCNKDNNSRSKKYVKFLFKDMSIMWGT
jgi:hypothetical protein